MTLVHCTEGWLVTDILKENGYNVILGPILTDRSKIELRNQNIKAPGILSKAGINVAIMTDHPCVPVQHLMLSASLAARDGMAPEEALKAITINAARCIKLDNRIGSLEIGKDADMVIYPGNPLDYSNKVKMTFINGRLVYENQEG